MTDAQLMRETHDEYGRLSDAATMTELRARLAEFADERTRTIRREIARIAPNMDELEVCAILASLVSALNTSVAFHGSKAKEGAIEGICDAVGHLEEQR